MQENTSSQFCPSEISDSCSISESFRRKEFSEESIKILLSSLAPSTQKQYKSHLKRWLEFCTTQKKDAYNATEKDIRNFLTENFKKRSQYGTINTLRSAISLISENNIGESRNNNRFVKGCAHLRPSKTKYNEIWDVDIVLNFLEKTSFDQCISLKELTLKAVTLLALCTAQRAQSISKIKIKNIKEINEKIVIYFDERLKTTRVGIENPNLELPKCKERPNLCVFSCVKKYMERTKNIRNNEDYLFISIKDPHKKVSSQTISRWIKKTLKDAGIDTSIFSAHSTRTASSSKAYSKGVDPSVIKNTANWSEKSVCQSFRKIL